MEYAYLKKEPEDINEREVINSVLEDNTENYIENKTIGTFIESSRELRTYEKKSLEKSNSEIEKKYIPQNIKFQLIALQPLKNCNDKYLKTLNKNELYRFNDKFLFEKDIIVYDKKKEFNLFNIDNLNLNLSIVVGKNGSGKSTLVELAFMIINNLSKFLFDNKKYKTPNYRIKYIEDNIHAKIYFFTDHLYEIIVDNKQVFISQFREIEYKGGKAYFQKNQFYNQDSFDFTSLYYTEHVNYSLHSLNVNYFGKWIDELFHKNDGYATPIVLEPFRDNGRIDINNLNTLVKDRIMISILLSESENNLKLTDKSEVIGIKLKINHKKLIERKIFPTVQELESFSNALDLNFKLENYKKELKKTKNEDSFLQSLSIKESILLYIYQKVSIIISRYSGHDFELEEFDKKNYFEVVESLLKKNSHVTYKLKRAINFLKYYEKFFSKLKTNNEMNNIEDIRSLLINLEAYSNNKLEELLIPSIFNIDIIFKNSNSFESLSSGEKQKIFSLTAILYHLKNIASIDDGYQYVNVVLDEIELYFHPEMQKDFINDLYESIKSDDFIRSNLNAINFIFITHSPFILSDIIHHDLMALKEDGSQLNSKELEPCFGANIYNLLHNSFFMKDFIGRFSKRQILDVLSIINLYKKEHLKKANKDLVQVYNRKYGEELTIEQFKYKKNEVKKRIELDKDNMINLVMNIGEKVLREEILIKLHSIKDDIEVNNSLDKFSISEIEQYLEKKKKNDKC